MPAPKPVPLDDQLCFSLYAANMAINRTYKPMLDAMGITYPQYLVLSVLGEHGEMTIGGIAERLALESSTVTPPVKRLEQAGLVRRQRGTEDERQVYVSLTDAGRKMVIDATCLGNTLVERSGLAMTEFNALNDQVRRLRDALGEGSSSVTPPSGLPAISPSRGESG